MLYNSSGNLVLSGVNPSITLGSSTVLTSANAPAYLNSTYLPLVPGNLKVGTNIGSVGTDAIAAGYGTSATGTNASAFGLGTSALGADQFVIGRYNTPTVSYNSPLDVMFLVGGGTVGAPKDALLLRADGTMYLSNRMVIGAQSSSYPEWTMGAHSLTVGDHCGAYAQDSVAFGVWSQSRAQGSIAAGYLVHAGGGTTGAITTFPDSVGAAAFGGWSDALYAGDFVFGHGSKASGYYSTAGGLVTRAEGYGSIAIGGYTLASGVYSVALGVSNEAKGTNSMAFGDGLRAYGMSQVALGHYNEENGTQTSYLPTDNLLIVGNGHPESAPEAGDEVRKNAMTIQHNGDAFFGGNVELTFKILDADDSIMLAEKN
jgi:hypothetical protein